MSHIETAPNGAGQARRRRGARAAQGCPAQVC